MGRPETSASDDATINEGRASSKEEIGQSELNKTGKKSSKWSRILPGVPRHPPPPKASLDDASMIPEATKGFFSVLTFNWMTSLIGLGYARPLEATDLYKLQDERSAAYIAKEILDSFDRRKVEAEEYNRKLENGEIGPGLKNVWWTLRGNREGREKAWREKDGKKKPNLIWAMNDSVKWWFWSAGVLKVISDTAQITSPLIVKAIINFGTESYTAHRQGTDPPAIGIGIGLAFGLLGMQLIASLCVHHFFYRSASTGVLLRAGLITAIYSRSMHLTNRARSKLTNGKLVNHISTDVSRIDFCCGFFHMGWTAPIQMIICLIQLLVNLGPSALAGYAFFVLVTPLQTWVMKKLFRLRQKSMVWTDKRAKLLQELLGGIKIIKYFAWETPFLKRISEYRMNEMAHIRSLLLIRSANNAIAFSLPVLASVISFVTYTAAGNTLNPADIFASLTLFNLLRMPLMFLPLAFSSIADASNAIGRLYDVFEAEVHTETKVVDTNSPSAIEVEDATFTWDAPPESLPEKVKKAKSKRKSLLAPKKVGAESPKDSVEKVQEPFKMQNVNFCVPKGQLVAIVGQVGSGKTSLLEGIIGEMRLVSGRIKFGGTVGYCPQSAWIQSATIRENICFGRPFDHDRYWKAVRDSCLQPDLEMLPFGDLTEVGEKGISLSGGQKQRINICRAIYCNTDIQIFDDPLSALDAHVGKAVFQNVLRDATSGKTRLLVTHALHFLPQVDYIYTLVDGRIAERGTYTELIANDGEFARFIREFGSKEGEKDREEEEEEAVEKAVEEKAQPKKTTAVGKSQQMQAEERNTGSISWNVYRSYLRAGNGHIILPLLLLSLVLIQGATVMSSYWLVYWQEMKFNQPQAFYMGIYAGIGVSQAIFSFFMGDMFAFLTYYASQHLHRAAIHRVLHAPMSFFDTTPLGRIMNRFSKDIDTIDNILGDSLRMFMNTFSSILGAIILISIILPWFAIAVCSILVLYFYAAVFYRASARELKRLDAILRSSLYSHFSESLSGLATIRAYGETERFTLENEERMNIENRAYWLTVANQRWLGIRLDFLGMLLVFIVAMLTVGTRFTISPSQTGVVLSYIISVQQAFGWMIRQTAEVENDMNSVERIVHYAEAIEEEAPHEIPNKAPAPSWPLQGRIELNDVVLKYRPALPAVLKGVSMSIGAGEKIGIVGRTGAGKSSIMTTLYRLVELSSGSISIDDVDISTIGLADLRSHLSIIPQDPLLFSGTLRTNLDPFGLHDDARLWDALRRSYLVEDKLTGGIEKGGDVESSLNRFNLDTPIEDEGGNLSIGQRSLVSLARALVKDSKILILDEATASVDYETDQKIQETIANEFYDRTILCIAHRLRTIIGYDRICVLDAGRIAEFDTPTRLFSVPGGIFRSMCDRSSITLEDINFAAKFRQAVADRHRHASS